jgi:hypothetical protein
MIKIFRLFRQRLLSENKFSKYLLYALGEIVLVVIGILIALQINTWNDTRKEKKLENEYYCRLLEDTKLDKEQISNLLELAENRLKASNASVRLLLKDIVNKKEVATQISLATKAIYSDFEPNNSAYEDLKSGANLNIIQDKSIIKALNRYFNKVEELKSIIMINGKHAVDVSFSHIDNFDNGSVLASIETGNFKTGLDKDLKDKILAVPQLPLSEEMKSRLLNESLVNVSSNTRQIELYTLMLNEILMLEQLLQSKCIVQN